MTEGDWDTMETSGTFSVTGANITAGTYSGTYGNLVIAANGDWTYSMSPAGYALAKSLDTGENVTDSLTITTDQGNVTVTITINGAEDLGTSPAGIQQRWRSRINILPP